MTIAQTHNAKQSHAPDCKQWGEDSKPCCDREQMVIKHERGNYEKDTAIRICCGQTPCHQKKDAISSNPQQPEPETAKNAIFHPTTQPHQQLPHPINNNLNGLTKKRGGEQ
eukprot:13611913-Ditylum_brightwellii.AAC.1